MARSNIRSEIDAIYDYGVNLEARKLYIIGEINDESVYKAVVGLDLLEQKSAERPITIYLNSEGGETYTGLSLFDAIKKFPAHATIIGSGNVMSMASFLLQAGDQRLLDKHATVMLHHGEDEMSGDLVTVKRWAAHGEYASRRLTEILAERTGRPFSYWYKRLHADVILTAEQALELNLCDGIV